MEVKTPVKTRILETAAELVARSPNADISTRAVCDAAGVTPPTLYHYFGDKEGLLAAVIDYGSTAFLESKRMAAVVIHEHVADDIRVGWDNHLEFARENPNFYKLMWAPGAPAANNSTVGEAFRILNERLEHGASKGQLRVSVESGTRVVLSAVTGAALAAIYQPELFNDPSYAHELREAVIAAVTFPPAATTSNDLVGEDEPTIAAAAATLKQQLAVENEHSALTTPERALMEQWLTTLANPGPTARS
jgi:AcrR family transcriptional regulator